MSELTDQMFGKYQLINRLAMGGMAEIFRAKLVGAAGFSREVVIKRIHPEFSEDEEFVRMFTNEAKWAALLRHPNIVQVLDFDRVDGTFYIAMEFIEGADLKRLQVRGRKSGVPLPHQLSLFIAIQALKGLSHAHQFEHEGNPLHIVHRDISPHNILISAQGEVKVTDFGIARVMQQSGATASGVLKGKASYMAPEQTFSSQVDHRADLFAMGVVLWELLCRRRLFAGNNDLLAIHNVREARIAPPHECDPTIPQELSDIVMEALARPLEERVEDARIWMRQLQSYLWLPSAAEELSLYLQQALNGTSVDTAFTQLDVFRPPMALPSLESMSNVSWSSLSAPRPETAPLAPFVPGQAIAPSQSKPMTAQLDGWTPSAGKKDPAQDSLASIRPEFAATGTANAFHESAAASAKSAPGHDWMIKTEAFGAAGSVGVMVDHESEPPEAGMSVVSTVQVNPSHVLSVLSQGSGAAGAGAGLASASVRASHTIGAVETVQLDPAAQLLGLEHDPLAKTQLDSEESTDMARQLAAMASQMGAPSERETTDVPIAETSLLEPARFLSAEVLHPPDADSTLRLRPKAPTPAPQSVHPQGPKANVAGWIVLGSSVLMVAALFIWLLVR